MTHNTHLVFSAPAPVVPAAGDRLAGLTSQILDARSGDEVLLASLERAWFVRWVPDSVYLEGRLAGGDWVELDAWLLVDDAGRKRRPKAWEMVQALAELVA